jgi:hypothetical protein
VSNDCKTWLAEVENELPTLVFAVMDSNGRDVPSVVIRVDGVEIPNATDGLGHPLDPGEHLVEATANGQSLRQQIVVRVGEKSRRIELRVVVAPPPPVERHSPPAPSVDRSAPSSGPPVGVYVLGGVAVAAIGVGSVLWITGSHAAKTYNADCASTGCTQGQRNGVARQLIVGDIAWGVGLAAGAGAVALFVLHHDSATTTAVSFGPSGVSLAGAF